MSTTKIHISHLGVGTFTATPDSAPFNTGDNVTFDSDPGAGDALICFSDNASESLTPSPDGPVALAAGASVTFAVSGKPEGGCCATVVSQGHEGTPDCPGVPSGVLYVRMGKHRPVPTDPPQQ